MQHANGAVDEVRRAQFFRKGRKMRDVIKGKKWSLLQPTAGRSLEAGLTATRGHPNHLRWQRLPSFQKLAAMLIKHLDGILNYCRTKVRFGVVEAVNGNIRMLINRGRGYQNLRYLLLKSKRMAVTNVEFIAVQTVKRAA